MERAKAEHLVSESISSRFEASAPGIERKHVRHWRKRDLLRVNTLFILGATTYSLDLPQPT